MAITIRSPFSWIYLTDITTIKTLMFRKPRIQMLQAPASSPGSLIWDQLYIYSYHKNRPTWDLLLDSEVHEPRAQKTIIEQKTELSFCSWAFDKGREFATDHFDSFTLRLVKLWRHTSATSGGEPTSADQPSATSSTKLLWDSPQKWKKWELWRNITCQNWWNCQSLNWLKIVLTCFDSSPCADLCHASLSIRSSGLEGVFFCASGIFGCSKMVKNQHNSTSDEQNMTQKYPNYLIWTWCRAIWATIWCHQPVMEVHLQELDPIDLPCHPMRRVLTSRGEQWKWSSKNLRNKNCCNTWIFN